MKKLLVMMTIAAMPFFGACSDSPSGSLEPAPNPPPQETQTVESDQGGQMMLDLGLEGSASADIPAFALSGDAEVTLAGSVAAEVTGMMQVGPAVEFRAQGVAIGGITVLLSPCTFSVPFDVELAGNAEVILMMQSGTNPPQQVSGAIAADGTITAQVTSFGTFWAAIEVIINLQINSCDPQTGPPSGGTEVTITGEGFLAGNLEVFFGATAAASIEVISDTEVKVIAPAHGEATVDLSVEIDGHVAVLIDAFAFLSAQIGLMLDSCNPTTAPSTGDIQITLNGSGFAAGQVTVTFGGELALDVQVISDTEITVTAPAHASGTVDLSVEVDGDVSILLDAFVFLDAGIEVVVGGCTPDTGLTIIGTPVQISGSGFAQAAANAEVIVMFGTQVATNVEVLANGLISCIAPPGGSGTVEVTVIIEAGGGVIAEGVLAGAFTYN